MRFVIFVLLLITCVCMHVTSQTVNAELVKMSPQFPHVGEVVELTLTYPSFNMRTQERFYAYETSDEVLVESVDFQGMAKGHVMLVLKLRPKHSGIVHIPSITENALYTIGVSPISVLSTINSQLNASASSQAVMRTYPPFPIFEVLYMLLAIVALGVFAQSFVVIVREISPMGRAVIKYMHNVFNIMTASYVVKKLLRDTRNMEKPTFARETISSTYFYTQIYKAIEIRFCFLYGPTFKTLTTDEMEKFLLRDIDDVFQQYRVPEQKHLSRETLHDFFSTLSEVLYGKKLSELSVRINHCQILLRLFFISRYIFKGQKISADHDITRLFNVFRNSPDTKRVV